MLHVKNVATTFDSQAIGPSSSIIIIDIDINEPESNLLDVQPSKKRKPEWQVQRHFQDIWATKFPWVEAMGEDGRMHHVYCRICIGVEQREKLLVPKLDRLYKHNGRRKCKHAKLGLKVGECYTSLHSQHAKNECIYGIIGPNSVLEQVQNAKRVDKKKKYL